MLCLLVSRDASDTNGQQNQRQEWGKGPRLITSRMRADANERT